MVVRSCTHIFSSDGGAGSIAGMDLTVAGADGIIFAFALWGSSQLLFAIMQFWSSSATGRWFRSID